LDAFLGHIFYWQVSESDFKNLKRIIEMQSEVVKRNTLSTGSSKNRTDLFFRSREIKMQLYDKGLYDLFAMFNCSSFISSVLKLQVIVGLR
jgi:hypothetical protein